MVTVWFSNKRLGFSKTGCAIQAWPVFFAGISTLIYYRLALIRSRAQSVNVYPESRAESFFLQPKLKQ
jgi:hypothetical protein